MNGGDECRDLFPRFVLQPARLINLRGQFFDAPDNAALLIERRKRDFVSKYIVRSNSGIVRRSLCRDLLSKRARFDEPSEIFIVETVCPMSVEEVVAAYD